MADDFLKRVGSVLGIGVGSMDLSLPRLTFTAGEEVVGRLVLRLEEPVAASTLIASVQATEERRRSVSDGRGGRIDRVETVTTYKFEQHLGGARTYKDETYDLRLPLPPRTPTAIDIAADALGRASGTPDTLGQVPSILGAMANVVRVAQQVRSPVTWRVHAVLEIPWKRNVRARADIAVR
jgi:hypothetical protein